MAEQKVVWKYHGQSGEGRLLTAKGGLAYIRSEGSLPAVIIVPASCVKKAS